LRFHMLPSPCTCRISSTLLQRLHCT
jgi:hypothetical protein